MMLITDSSDISGWFVDAVKAAAFLPGLWWSDFGPTARLPDYCAGQSPCESRLQQTLHIALLQQFLGGRFRDLVRANVVLHTTQQIKTVGLCDGLNLIPRL